MVQDIVEHSTPQGNASGVQSVQRALDLLEIVTEAGGEMAIGELAAASDIPLPTIHRLLRTLVERGYMRQLPSRRYALGFRLVPLGVAANAMIGDNAQSVLGRLVDDLGETANLAILSGDHAEYVAQVPSRHAMRMFTEVGRRVELHCTGVGKALLAQLDDSKVEAIVRRVGMPAYTPHTLTSEAALQGSLTTIRELGYSLDEEEQEIGVRCVAVPIPAGMAPGMAVSVSGPLTRMTPDVVARAVPLLQEAATALGDDLSGAGSPSTGRP